MSIFPSNDLLDLLYNGRLTPNYRGTWARWGDDNGEVWDAKLFVAARFVDCDHLTPPMRSDYFSTSRGTKGRAVTRIICPYQSVARPKTLTIG